VKLRLRVTLTLFLVLIPSVMLFTYWRFGSEKRDAQSRIASQFVNRFSERPPERCIRRPERFKVERRGMRVFAYDSNFVSANPEAPPFPQDLQKVAIADEPVHQAFWRGKTDGVTVGRIMDDGPCAIVLVDWGQAPNLRGFVIPTLIQALIFALLLALTGLLVTYPIVGRIRKLQKAVEDSTDDGPDVAEELSKNDELGDLARALDTSSRSVRETIIALKTRDESLSNYVANTTHDLAIPLTVLQHRLTRARDEMPKDSEAWKHVEVALQESSYIAALISNMSLATKLERGELGLTLHKVDLREVAERIYARHLPIAEGKSIDFNLGVPEDTVMVDCDSVMVEQALSNLVQNAVQYTPDGGHVSVILESNAHGFELTVLDDGPGIPAALLEDVTTRGVRGDAARTRNSNGQGFGLNIAQQVLDRHGWELEMTSMQPGLRARISSRADG